MSDVFVKICGLCREEDLRATIDAAPDAIGWVFWPKSSRYIEREQAVAWRNLVPSSIKLVGVFVDPEPDALRSIVQKLALDVVQLHCSGPVRYDLGGLCKVWQSMDLSRDAVPEASNAVDAYVIDHYSEQSPGGTGQTCDWTRGRQFVAGADRPVILAGGLHAGNVQAAIQQVQPWGVDVSSGVEDAPGQKNVNKVKEFITLCRNQ
jgi:phosphoribosylanthranilate isomerase